MPILVDLKRSAWTVLLVTGVTSVTAADAPPSISEPPPVPAFIATPPPEKVETSTNSPRLAPAPIDSKRANLPSLPVNSPLLPALLPSLPVNSPAGAAAVEALPQLNGDTPQLPIADAAQQEQRLHQGLQWDVCGPRAGAGAINPRVQFTETKQQPIDIVANRIDGNQRTNIIELQGDIALCQQNQRVEADWSRYDRSSGQINAAGALYLETPQLRLTGDAAEYNLTTQQGSIDHARYRLSGNANLRGEAEHAWLLPEQVSRYQNILYTTCPPGHSDWSLKASTLELDQVNGMGTAHHARLRIADIPILYTPYLRFPIDGRRRSGLLTPSFGSSNETGTDITLPYYWNIAPNLDATLTPRYMSTRGLMLGAQVRYLSAMQELEVNAEVLPNDRRAPEQGLRDALRIEQRGQFGAHWSSVIDYSAVSDDQYLQEFGNRLDITSLRNLTRRADLTYGGNGWHLLTRMQEFQTVDTSIAPANRPYGQLPHIALNLDPQRWHDWLEYGITTQYDYFDHNAAVHGSRFVTVPSLRVPLRESFGYLIPRTRLFYTEYDLTDQTSGWSTHPTHLIPSVDLDGKLIFERETHWFGGAMLQTLEPRLYYVRTAYADQSENPRFDTTALDFSFASLFRAGRFTGYDRISDENRLTLGLTSRTIASQRGAELFRASLGQVFYFANRRVQLDGATNAVDSERQSALAGELSALLTPNWSLLVNAQWNPQHTDSKWEKQVLQLRYAPNSNHLLTLAYHFNLGTQTAERYEDTDLAFQIPLGSKVKLVGRWLYSLLNDETVEAFAGVEFGRCCWRLRLLGQHLKRSADQSGSTSVMLQLELAGLGSFGNRIDQLLERGIYGYQTD
ncbi:organic solvent tolerance protein [Chromatium weissei]|nr:organic solvent tolerance protein [Chromatium weissei]